MNKIDKDLSSDELLFESNIAEASKRIERDKMKAILQKTEIESKVKVTSLKRTWWYAAAACLVIGVSSILIFQSKNYYEPVLSSNDVKKE
jgi:formate/nitrite transporter FocA (FNT family)